MRAEYAPETVREKVEAFPALFEDHRVVEIDDDVAAERGTHEPGETLFVARVRRVDSTTVALTDVYRASDRPDGAPGTEPAPHLYFVAKHWSDPEFDRDDVRLYDVDDPDAE